MTAEAPDADRAAGASSPTPSARRALLVHRLGAVVVAVVIAVFGVLGLVGGLGFFDTEGAPVLGLSTNGALSTVSLVTAVVLVAAAWRGGRLASTLMTVIGALFLVSAFVNLWLIGTAANLLAFRLPNVFFSIGAGLVLLVLGAYGRLSGRLPDDNPYRVESGAEPHEDLVDHQPRPNDAGEAAADAEMAEAERIVATGGGDDELRRRVASIGELRSQEERRARWRSFDDAGRRH